MIICGNTIALKIKSNLKKRIAKLSDKPGLGIIWAGNDPPSEIFIRNKIRFCEETGIKVKLKRIKGKTKQLENKIKKAIIVLNKSENIHGIILQLPLPSSLRPFQEEFFQLIDPGKDVDVFNPFNLGRLGSEKKVLVPAVVRACLEIFKIKKISLKGKNVLAIGWGQVVGKPLVPTLLKSGATVTVFHEYSNNLGTFSRQADIIISAAGKPRIIKGTMVKKGVIAIDVGCSMKNGKVSGDFDFASVQKKARLITPVPGGIGPMTVAMVAQNTLECYINKK